MRPNEPYPESLRACYTCTEIPRPEENETTGILLVRTSPRAFPPIIDYAEDVCGMYGRRFAIAEFL